jgi:tetratricopeptide (TPR) repeat protein
MKDIERLFGFYAERAWEHLDDDARAILSAMLAFPAMVAVPSRLLRKAAGLDDTAFRKGATIAGLFGLLERDVANDTFDMQRIPRDCMRRRVARIENLEAAENRLADHLLGFLSDENVLCRPEITDRYWNTLVRPEMAKVDPYWPIINHVMRRAAENGKVAQFVVLLAHYMDSRFLNAERLEFLGHALAELEHKDPLMVATLRIDALAWTYLEEGLYKEAQGEIATGLRLLGSEPAHDLRALAHAWTARLKCADSHSMVEAMESLREAREHALKVGNKYWISMRVEMMAGDVQMMQHNAQCARKHYQDAESLMQRYGGEGNSYQTAPRMGFALLELGEYAEAERLFRMLAENAPVATGRLYGEYGLALIAARGEATQEAVRHLRTIHRGIARRGSGNVLMVLANSLYQRILANSPAVG